MENLSLWEKTVPIRPDNEPTNEMKPLPKDLHARTLIVGGGICGLLTAYELHERGEKEIVLIEKKQIAQGVSARTTAKITAQHHLIYHTMINGLGQASAAQYAKANQTGVERIAQIIQTHEFSCDFQCAQASIYASQESDVKKIQQEYDACARLSMDVCLEDSLPLPIPIHKALIMPRSAHFHPIKFCIAIADWLKAQGVLILEHTTATPNIEEGLAEGRMPTNRGSISFERAIFCTHFPLMDKKGLYFARIYQERSYALALNGIAPLPIMAIDCDTQGLSFRPHLNLQILGGFSHKSGHEGDILHHQLLEETALRLFPHGQIAAQWSTQDCVTHDAIPYVGHFSQLGEHFYLVTGFNKWGMSTSSAAATHLADLLSGDGKQMHVFTPSRHDIQLTTPSFITQGVDVVMNYAKTLNVPFLTYKDLEKGQGALIGHDGQTIGAYRDEEGRLHGVIPTCPHMRCPLSWNPDESSWDCPCHGSRFSIDGDLLHHPAAQVLQKIDLRDDHEA